MRSTGCRTRNWRGPAIGVVLLVGALLQGGQLTAQTTVSRPLLKVLFVGNSYTYFHNLGEIVAGIAAADSDGPIVVPTLAVRGSATLKWHLENGPALKLLQAKGWDYVVLQEQSLLGGQIDNGKTVVGDPAEFFDSVRKFVPLVRSAGATPILFMTWAGREPTEATSVQKQLADAYLTMGRVLGVKVAPVGLAWEEARRRLRSIELHIWDASHPTPTGSYLAGLVIYSTLTGRTPLGAPSLIYGHPTVGRADAVVIDSSLRVPLVDIQDATAKALQETAWAISSANR